jgi:hypothetical protein
MKAKFPISNFNVNAYLFCDYNRTLYVRQDVTIQVDRLKVEG